MTCIQLWIPKVIFGTYTSLCSTRATIFPFRRFPGRPTHAYYMICIYIYIFRWWLDTAGSVSPKGRLRLDGVCCDWAFALLCYDVGSVTTGTPAHHPTLWLCVGDVGIWTSGVCCGMARDWRSPSFRSVAIHLIYKSLCMYLLWLFDLNELWFDTCTNITSYVHAKSITQNTTCTS